MKRVLNRTAEFGSALVAHSKRHPKKSMAGAAVAVLVLAAIALLGGGKEETMPEEQKVPSVRVATVAALSGSEGALVLVGEVRSVSQAELRAEKSGEVTRVNVKPGQYVAAGTVLVEIDSAAERAAVLSAQGALAAAEAQYAKVRGGARSEDRASASAQAENAVTAFASAQDAARAAYSSAYSTAYDAVYAKADTFFTNQFTVRPSFRVNSASYDERITVSTERAALNAVLDTWKASAQTPPTNGDLVSALTQAQNDLERIKTFIDTIGVYVSKQDITSDYTASDKAADEAVVAAARGALDGARQSVAGARQGLAAAESAQKVTSLTESKIVTGAEATDLRVAEAAVMSARGALGGAAAALERSIIRTPIAGTVTTLNISQGDYASMQSVIAVVANPGALEVEAFVSDAARERISVGASALVAGRYNGTVTTLSPGLDPDTKKARFTVGLEKDVTLTNGQSVEIALIGTSTVPLDRTTFSIPLAAIKVLPDGLAVFTVRDDGTVESHPIREGAITGDRMIIADDLTPDLRIIIDVRGLREGERVEVSES